MIDEGTAIKGRNTPYGKAPRQFALGRVCVYEGCSNVLSRYNSKTTCYVHTHVLPLKYRHVTRGR